MQMPGTCHWIGAFPLQVDVRDQAGRKIAAVAAETIWRHEEAKFFLSDPNSNEFNLIGVPWVEGQPFTLNIICGGCSGNGYETYQQRQTLLLRVHYADGSTRHIAAPIPDGRVRRFLKVSIP